MAKSMIVGNWKMNTTVAEAEALAGGIASGVPDGLDVVVAVCPPFVSLVNVQATLVDRGISVGAQDTHFEVSGAFTGEVSSQMLVGICQYVIVGHSERRTIFTESDCVGESEGEGCAGGVDDSNTLHWRKS